MSVRKGGAWKARKFRSVWMTQMGKCERCGVAEYFIYRKGGISGALHSGDLHQIVHRTSNLELDHIVPLCEGGSNDHENLQLLCCDCHKAKTLKEVAKRAKVRRQALGRQVLRVPA